MSKRRNWAELVAKFEKLNEERGQGRLTSNQFCKDENINPQQWCREKGKVLRARQASEPCKAS